MGNGLSESSTIKCSCDKVSNSNVKFSRESMLPEGILQNYDDYICHILNGIFWIV